MRVMRLSVPLRSLNSVVRRSTETPLRQWPYLQIAWGAVRFTLGVKCLLKTKLRMP